jgi:hypothetical protein
MVRYRIPFDVFFIAMACALLPASRASTVGCGVGLRHEQVPIAGPA